MLACIERLFDRNGPEPRAVSGLRSFSPQPASGGFDQAQKTILEHSLRDFRLSGIDLPPEAQKRYAEVQSKLSELGSKFSNQLLDATQAWTKHITDEAALAGLTDSAKAQMAAAAQAKGLDGWLISLEFPSYYPVMTYAQDRALREEVYAAYCTRRLGSRPECGFVRQRPGDGRNSRSASGAGKTAGFWQLCPS